MKSINTKNGKITFDQFEIEDRQTIIACPEKQKPGRAMFNEKETKPSAHTLMWISASSVLALRNARLTFRKKKRS